MKFQDNQMALIAGLGFKTAFPEVEGSRIILLDETIKSRECAWKITTLQGAGNHISNTVSVSAGK